MKNNINFEWLICPNCESDNLIQSSLVDKDKNEVIKRVLICQDCDYYLTEKFIPINWAEVEEEFNVHLPRA